MRPKSQPPNYEEYTRANDHYMQALEQETNKTMDYVPFKEPESATGEDNRNRHSHHDRLLMANHEITNGD